MPIAVEVCGILNASRSVRGGYAWHLVTADYRESMGAGTPCIVDTRPEATGSTTEPYCACGRRVSECDQSRAGCAKARC